MEQTVQAPARVRQPRVATAVRQEQWGVVGELMAALGETGPRKGRVAHDVFWTMVGLGGAQVARELVEEAVVVAAGEGMATADGGRRRTLGGVWFRLAGQRLRHRGPPLKERASAAFEKRARRKLLEVETTAAERADIERELVELEAARVERARAVERRQLMQAQAAAQRGAEEARAAAQAAARLPKAAPSKEEQKAQAKLRRAAKKVAEKATGPRCACQEPGGVACPRHPGRVAAPPKPKPRGSCSKRPPAYQEWLGVSPPPAWWAPGVRPACRGCGCGVGEECLPQEPLDPAAAPIVERPIRSAAPVLTAAARRAPVVEVRRPVEVEVVVARRRPVGGA